MSGSLLQYVTFFLDESLLGINVMQVQELLPPQTMTTVPLAAAEVRGLLNLRGHIVPAIDLRLRFGYSEETDINQAMNVIVRHRGELKSILVDRIGDVLEFDKSTLEPPPSGGEHSASAYTRGVHQLESSLLLEIILSYSYG